MRTLGIDFGEKRIGLALSDPAGRLALPHSFIERRSDRQAAHAIAAVARQEEAQALVIGEPRELDGNAGPRVDRVRRFGHKLSRITGLPLRFIDETLTTVEAQGRLGRLSRKLEDGRLDAVAAQILLQEALDASDEGSKS